VTACARVCGLGKIALLLEPNGSSINVCSSCYNQRRFPAITNVGLPCKKGQAHAQDPYDNDTVATAKMIQPRLELGTFRVLHRCEANVITNYTIEPTLMLDWKDTNNIICENAEG
jgi:hypothetical protein